MILHFKARQAVYEGNARTGEFKNSGISLPDFATGVYASANPGFVANLRRRHLHAATHRRVKCQKLRGDGLLLIQHTHNRVVRFVGLIAHEVSLASHDARSSRHAGYRAHLSRGFCL